MHPRPALVHHEFGVTGTNPTPSASSSLEDLRDRLWVDRDEGEAFLFGRSAGGGDSSAPEPPRSMARRPPPAP
ncbi:hypothetical protein SVIOM74S_04560 [Streptomyces violarus]